MAEERRLWTIAFPAPSRGQLGKRERREKKHLTPSQEAEKTFKRDSSSTSHLYQESDSLAMNHTHPQQMFFLRRTGEAKIDAMSIAKGKTPARHAYLFTVQDEQMDKEGKEEKGEKKAVSILIGNSGILTSVKSWRLNKSF